MNANWSGVYSVTDKFRILDSFRYDNWRTPGLWDTAETNIFGQMQPGLVGLAQPQAVFTAANVSFSLPRALHCGLLVPVTARVRPPTWSTAPRRVFWDRTSDRIPSNSNTISVKRLTGRIGYEYTARTIADFNATFYSAETYFPGGTGGTAANDYFAARGDCAVPCVPVPRLWIPRPASLFR